MEIWKDIRNFSHRVVLFCWQRKESTVMLSVVSGRKVAPIKGPTPTPLLITIQEPPSSSCPPHHTGIPSPGHGPWTCSIFWNLASTIRVPPAPPSPHHTGTPQPWPVSRYVQTCATWSSPYRDTSPQHVQTEMPSCFPLHIHWSRL